ncbi:MAG: menaquinol oxidoreductase [bacterium]|nr:menaquinol oxidoreductase [bacterium]
MTAILALGAILILILLAGFGSQVAGLQVVFGVAVPYAAIALFLGGLVFKVMSWARTPVPFRIPTTCGQQKTLDWIPSARFDNPHTTLGVIGRMALEVLFFRSLFRNTKVDIRPGGRIIHTPAKWLWAAALAFHYSFLVIFIRHLRFFTEPVPGFVKAIQSVDSFFEIGVPSIFLTSFLLLGALGFLLLRRLVSPQLRYISLANDYFPLFLLIAIGTTGVLMRHFQKTDIETIKAVAMGILSFSPVTAGGGALFTIHFFLVCVLFAVFPYSKLMHMAGVFMSPTRNMANTNRAKRHINPWNHPVAFRTYEEYEDDFRDKMKAAGIPVEKE